MPPIHAELGEQGVNVGRKRIAHLLRIACLCGGPPGVDLADKPRMDPVPALGQHTDAVLRELGYSDSQVGALRETGAV